MEKAKAHRESLDPGFNRGGGGQDVEDFRSAQRARERDSREQDGRSSRCQSAFLVLFSLLGSNSACVDDEKRRSNDDRDRNPKSIPTGPRADRNKGPPQFTSRSGGMAPPPPPGQKQGDSSGGNSGADDGTGMTSSELSAIRSRYLGVDKKKRPVRKISDRKFVFDWAEQDDTFAMDSPSAVGSQRQGAAVMFGRGHLAGMENTSVPHLPRPSSSSSAAAAGEGSSMVLDATGRKKVAIDERHWSEKPLSEMKDRDWRIFREDFSISARGRFFVLSMYNASDSWLLIGGNIPHALRSWDESAIPPPILDIIAGIGYKDPSPIQRQAIPIGLQNRDLIGIAETGLPPSLAYSSKL